MYRVAVIAARQSRGASLSRGVALCRTVPHCAGRCRAVTERRASMQDAGWSSGAVAFALIYFTFFLDNVLLTVLVPIIPDWVRGEALALWTRQDAPLASLLNHTVRHIDADTGNAHCCLTHYLASCAVGGRRWRCGRARTRRSPACSTTPCDTSTPTPDAPLASLLNHTVRHIDADTGNAHCCLTHYLASCAVGGRRWRCGRARTRRSPACSTTPCDTSTPTPDAPLASLLNHTVRHIDADTGNAHCCLTHYLASCAVGGRRWRCGRARTRRSPACSTTPCDTSTPTPLRCRRPALALWTRQDAPLASLLNHTVRLIDADTGNAHCCLTHYLASCAVGGRRWRCGRARTRRSPACSTTPCDTSTPTPLRCRRPALALWTRQDAPLASLLNHTVRHIDADTGNAHCCLTHYLASCAVGGRRWRCGRARTRRSPACSTTPCDTSTPTPLRCRRPALALWTRQDAPLASLLNHTVRHIDADTGNAHCCLTHYLASCAVGGRRWRCGRARTRRSPACSTTPCDTSTPTPLRCRRPALALWTRQDAPLASLLNHTVRHIDADTGGGSQALVGLVLGAKAAAQLLAAPLAGAAVCRRGAAPVLRAATATLAGAAIVFTCVSGRVGWRAALCVALGRAAHGAGAALANVAGLALAASAVPEPQRDRAIGALLGAVALGVLVGYPFGGATYALWSRGAPFLLIAAALGANLGNQRDNICFSRVLRVQPCSSGGGVSWRGVAALARRGSAGACAGAVLLTTAVMAALEPCLPLWVMHKFHPQRWVTGAVFIPDSAGYLLAASLLGGAARRLGAERVALAGQLCVAAAALAVPHASSVSALALPHLLLGGGLGAADAALVPALLARHPHRAPHVAALLQAASSAAYALGPVVGGAVSWCVGFETALRTLAVLNLLYLACLYRALARHPLSEQWGAISPDDESDDSEARAEDTPLAPLAAQPPRALRAPVAQAKPLH
ncbi:hypothetical protein PYW07_010657 [Mythimna separata]|uniref:Synaptic vesicular amine transporter n=1 Tax=Mythimna separata TaxID=271217 RepID=A0AAD7YA84_MYTSE|nr:hypothetical protein PYW07_010657 [Mythimna separata]